MPKGRANNLRESIIMEITTVSLKQLKPSKRNLRTVGTDDIDDLVSSIKAEGLLQSLVVIPNGKGYEVVAGGRRLAALKQLKWKEPVPVRIIDADQAETASLSENFIRRAFDPLELWEAIVATKDASGMTQKQLANRLNQPVAAIRRALRLGDVHPDIREAFRKGELREDALKAFAASPDKEIQKRVFDELDAYWPQDIRSALGFAFDVKRHLEFVGIEAYKAAGGKVEHDLFGDSLGVSDRTLLLEMVENKQFELDKAEAKRLGIEVISADDEDNWGYAWLDRRASDEDEARIEEIEDALYNSDEEIPEENREALNDERNALIDKREPIFNDNETYGIRNGRILKKIGEENATDDIVQPATEEPEQDGMAITAKATAELAKMRDEMRRTAYTRAGHEPETAMQRLAYYYLRTAYSRGYVLSTPSNMNKAEMPKLPSWITEGTVAEGYEAFCNDPHAIDFVNAAFCDLAPTGDSFVDTFTEGEPQPEWNSTPEFWNLFRNKEQVLTLIEEFAPTLAERLTANKTNATNIRLYAHRACSGEGEVPFPSVPAEEFGAAQSWVPSWLRLTPPVMKEN